MKDLTSLFADLNVLYNSNKHSEVAKTCQRLIEGGVEDRKPVLKQWLIALVKSDQYKKSWDLLTQFGSELNDGFYLERLYVLYKLGYAKEFEKLYEEVKKAVHQDNSQSRGVLHVRAQFCFKNGKYDEATEIYRVLGQNNENQPDNETEIACNERAALSFSSLAKESEPHTAFHDDSYDFLLNESLIALAQGRTQLSLEHLEKAAALAAQDGLDDDKFAIGLQRAYVLQLSGNVKASRALLQSLLENSQTGSTNYLLAFSNLKSLQDISKYTTNIPLLLRELNAPKLSGIVGTLGLEQQKRVLSNLLFLNLFGKSSIQAKRSTLSKTLAHYQKVVDDPILEPYQSQAKKLFHHAESVMSCSLEGSVVGLVLLAVQLQVVEKQYDRAIILCEKFVNNSSDCFSTSYRTICYVLFELYQKAARSRPSHILAQRIYDNMRDEYVIEDPQFWRFIAFKMQAKQSYEHAEEVFAKLQTLCPSLSLTELNGDRREQIGEDLDSLIETVDVEALKIQGISPFDSRTRRRGESALTKTIKRRRVHKNRKLPKNCDLASLPNPERWLPLKDRSDYKPNKKVAAKLTQGGSATRKGTQNLDMSKSSKTKKRK
ncbi:signal recognition particle subunit SRP72 LALA0_S05e06216g [Lachancea lanzarotensis]|uniref:Signal recognition particle subunit SRP72 n=1 Tax=Lachancea lanzarotensis TaxID=1245769 RepID=A0A0C7MRB0_9SACH|nr:uncharacterized protein LALA0_S05e06216g [Lachancea lanzarotensis]CEP62463.1 LALA0S05e06216g1_1 [Lachancea lanzarotensis]